MRPLGEVSLRLARRAVALAETRAGVGIVFLVALAVWWLQALVIPLDGGRDLGTYLGAYIQLFQAHPIDLGYVLGRTPGATLIVGGLLQFAGGALAEPVVSLLYAGSIVAWFVAARTFGVRVGLLTVVVLLAYPGYGILFHELSSDSVFAAAFAGWALLVIRVLRSPSTRGWALVGAGVGALVLVRPGNQILLLLVLLPLLSRVAPRVRMTWAAAFVVPALVLIGGWAVHNGIRYDNYTIARGGNATVPFFRAFVTDKLVRPDNGPQSRELARAVQRDLIPKEPYSSYHITLDDFFTKASPRMQVDLLALSDRIKGWHSNYSWLRDVGIEAVRTHPLRYTRGVLGSVSGMLRLGLYRDLSPPATAAPSTGASTAVAGGLPTPTEGEPIPAAHEGGVTTPDNSIYTVWTSPTEHHLVFVHPGAEQRYNALHARMDELAANLPHRAGNETLALRMNQASRWFPPPIVWLVLGIAALAFRRLRGSAAVWVPTLSGLLVILVAALGLPAEPHYSVPVAPAFVVLAGAALLAPRGELAPVAAWRAAVPRLALDALRLAVSGAALVAAAWAVRHYVSQIDVYVDSNTAPHDLDVFLRAAGRVLHGASPYAFQADETYAYPPLLAWFVALLHPLGAGAATVVWALLSVAAVGAALVLLRVRDWRCYALASVFLFTRSAVDLGTVAPFLLLAVAAAWRWRDRLVAPAAAVGAGIALKLFLWPLVLWLAVTRRTRAAGGALVTAVLLVLVPWAAIGFKGLFGYAGLLRHLSRDEASSSYSIVALAVRAHLPQSAGVVIALLVAAVLLVAAAWVARTDRVSFRDREVAVLTLALAAAFAASPIVWIHYFLLLLVPLALTQPRLSLVWLVPFAYAGFGEAAWPAGDARKLGLALAATVALLGFAFVHSLGRRPRLRLRVGPPAEDARGREPAGVKTTSA